MNILTFAAGGAGTIAIIAIGTLLLPRQIHIERQATIDTTPQKIIALAGSSKGYQQFNPYLTADPNLKITPFGPEAGVGSGFQFNGKDGNGKQTVAAISDTAISYNIDLGARGKPVQTITANQTENGTLVKWTMDMDLGMNPIARVFGLFMDNMIGKTFEQGLTNLAAAT